MMNAMMKMNGDMNPMDMVMSMQVMDMNEVMYDELGKQDHKHHHQHQHHPAEVDTIGNMIDLQGLQSPPGIKTLKYSMLAAKEITTLPDVPVKVFHFTLTGNMNRYVWSINNKVVREWDKIKIEKGHNVRIVMFNNSMMRHPMHLHGHDFRIVNGQGEQAPLKNVLDIMPMETDTIEFAGSQDGDWFFHCHILYHMMAGMGNVFSYNNSQPNPQIQNKAFYYRKFLNDQKMIHPMAELALLSNGTMGKAMISGQRYEARLEWDAGWDTKYEREAELQLGRYFGKMQWWFPILEQCTGKPEPTRDLKMFLDNTHWTTSV